MIYITQDGLGNFYYAVDSDPAVKLLPTFAFEPVDGATTDEVGMYNIYGGVKEYLVTALATDWDIIGHTFVDSTDLLAYVNSTGGYFCRTPQTVLADCGRAALIDSLLPIAVTTSFTGAPPQEWFGKTVIFYSNVTLTPDNEAVDPWFAFTGIVMDGSSVTWGTPLNDAVYKFGAPPVCTEKRPFYFMREMYGSATSTNNFVILQ